MVAFALLGNLPMIAGTDILKATTISGTMVIGLAPIFLLAARVALLAAVVPPGVLARHRAGRAAGLNLIPPSWAIGGGKYARAAGHQPLRSGDLHRRLPAAARLGRAAASATHGVSRMSGLERHRAAAARCATATAPRRSRACRRARPTRCTSSAGSTATAPRSTRSSRWRAPRPRRRRCASTATSTGSTSTTAAFAEINQRVLAHDAIAGQRRGRVRHARATTPAAAAPTRTASTPASSSARTGSMPTQGHGARHPELRARIAALPMLARYQVGDCRVGVVHGDADVAGRLALRRRRARRACGAAVVAAVVRSGRGGSLRQHPHLPAGACGRSHARRRSWVVNNGAAGMPNFAANLRPVHAHRHHAFAAPRVARDAHRRRLCGAAAACATTTALAEPSSWRSGRRDARRGQSYFDRIANGPKHTPEQAIGAAHAALTQAAAAAMAATAATR